MGFYLPGTEGVASPGVAPDGLKGQVLAKASNLDFDTEWVDVEIDAAAENARPPLYAITTTYTASGAISPTDHVAVINAASAVSMTLAAGPSDGHSMVIKRFGAGAVTVTAVFDGANFSIVADSATIRESVQLTWAPSLAAWLILC
jgi:hypothetical protein